MLDAKPMVARLLGYTGRLWLQPHGTWADNTIIWLNFGRDGSRHGKVSLAKGTTLFAANEHYTWSFHFDEIRDTWVATQRLTWLGLLAFGGVVDQSHRTIVGSPRES